MAVGLVVVYAKNTYSYSCVLQSDFVHLIGIGASEVYNYCHLTNF